MHPWCLPQELIDIVVQFLHDDGPTLCACSLVCRSWKNPAHRLLFRYLRCIVGARDGLARCEELPNFLKSSPTICKYVQVLIIDGAFFRPHVKLDSALLAHMLSALPSLKEFRLLFMTVTPHRQDESKVATSERALEVLSIKHIVLTGESPFSFLLQLLRPISSVESLHIEDILRKHEDEAADGTLDVLSRSDLPTHLKVRSVTLKSLRLPSLFFIKTFMEFPPGTIQSLDLELPRFHDRFPMLELNALLGVIGPGLQDLTVDIPLYAGP